MNAVMPLLGALLGRRPSQDIELPLLEHAQEPPGTDLNSEDAGGIIVRHGERGGIVWQRIQELAWRRHKAFSVFLFVISGAMVTGAVAIFIQEFWNRPSGRVWLLFAALYPMSRTISLVHTYAQDFWYRTEIRLWIDSRKEPEMFIALSEALRKRAGHDGPVNREVRAERSDFDAYSRDTVVADIWGADHVQTLHFDLPSCFGSIPVQIDYVRGTGHPSGRNKDKWKREESLLLRAPGTHHGRRATTSNLLSWLQLILAEYQKTEDTVVAIYTPQGTGWKDQIAWKKVRERRAKSSDGERRWFLLERSGEVGQFIQEITTNTAAPGKAKKTICDEQLVIALFVGHPGVGKSQLVEYLARELKYPVYHVNLFEPLLRKVSLSQAFGRDVLEHSRIVLLIDEATEAFFHWQEQTTQVPGNDDGSSNVPSRLFPEWLELMQGNIAFQSGLIIWCVLGDTNGTHKGNKAEMKLSGVPRVGAVERAELYMGKKSYLWQLTTRFTHVVNIKPLDVEEQCKFIEGFYGKLLAPAVATELVRLWAAESVRRRLPELTVRTLGDFLEGCRIYATEQQWFPVAIPDEEASAPTDASVGSHHRRQYHAGGGVLTCCTSLAFTCEEQEYDPFTADIVSDCVRDQYTDPYRDACIVLSEHPCIAHRFIEYVVVSGRDFYFAEETK